jgi:hypothetical protein
MKKVFIVSCVLLLLSVSVVFAQTNKNGAVLGTFGLGGGFTKTVETTGMFSFLFDLNLISKAGVTLSFTDVAGFSSVLGWVSQNIMFGGGYHYMRDKWSVGLSILLCPLVYPRTLVNAHYDMSRLNAFMGVSVRPF